MTPLDKILAISKEELSALDTSFINPYNFYHNVGYFHGEPGREHYRLLMYVASIYEKEVLCDLGTNRCMSAAAMSYRWKNVIKSYDIVKIHEVNPIIPKVEWIIGDIREDDISQIPFIFMDVDHDGKFENIFYDHLIKTGWEGLLMLDDIHLNEPMEEFWARVGKSHHTFDLTDKGHWSGTGLVVFK